MMHFKQYFICKVFSLVLISLLLLGNLSLQSQNDENVTFSQAITHFSQGHYEQALSLLEEIEGSLEKGNTLSRTKLYLFYGACYEKMEKANLAKLYYKKIQDLLHDGLIKQLPEIEAIDYQSLQVYQQVFGNPDDKPDKIAEKDEEKDEYHFRFKKPEPISPIDKQELIYSKAKLKKKKKFPWLPVIAAGIVVAGVIAYFLFIRKGSEKTEVEVPEIEWVYIPPGEFLMGDNFKEGDADEQPVHAVYLDGYYISKYEISTYQFDRYCKDNGLALHSNLYPSSQLTPAVYVSWFDAQTFCEWLSQKTGQNIRLPTEAQWERAARGTQQFRYPWGNSPPDCSKVNFNYCNYYPRWVDQYPTGQTPSGIFNMAGNVSEWCRDWYDNSYYSQSPYQNPQGPNSGPSKVIRGGCFTSPANEIRSANRDFRSTNESSLNIGFRIVKEEY